MSTYYMPGTVQGAGDETVRQGPSPEKPAVKWQMPIGTTNHIMVQALSMCQELFLYLYQLFYSHKMR